MPYGISNQLGQTTPDELVRILSLARESGIQVLDTAAEYGNSESALGAALGENHSFRIVTKTPNFGTLSPPDRVGSVLTAAFERSLLNLRQQRVYGLLVHNAGHLLMPGGDIIWAAMEALRDQGLTQKIGVSVYTAQQIDAVLSRFEPTLVQVPISIVDQRLAGSGHLAKLKRQDVEVHARSVFLQGLLLMKPEEIPQHFKRFERELSNYAGFLARHRLSPVEGALSFIRQVAEVDVAIVGVNCRAQLRECMDAFRVLPEAIADFATVASHSDMLLNPALWPGPQQLRK
jgi:aryl-alcohol dehydrogenase-like predicted oxidoreductase